MFENKGLCHLYWGYGKGKTTAAVGLAVRVLGQGGKVLLTQFLKGLPTGETSALEKLGAQVCRTPDVTKFWKNMSPEEQEECRRQCRQCWEAAGKALAAPAGSWDLVILDEVTDAAELGLLDAEEILEAVRSRTGSCEVVMTGHQPSSAWIEAADYVTEMRCQRHPYTRGVTARRGVEY